MKRKRTHPRTLIAGALALAVVACAPMTEERREYLQYQRQVHAHQFKLFRARCLSEGGQIVIYGSGRVGRDGIPQRSDPSFCVDHGRMKRFGPGNNTPAVNGDSA